MTDIDSLRAERDAAQWRETAGRYLSALVEAERQRDEVGIQLVAAQAEIVRMRRVVEIARAPVLRGYLDLQDALRALDTVPGDVLERP